MDVTGSAYGSFEDVRRYCYRHSGALAELSAVLMGARSEATLLSARLLGNSYRLAYITTAGVSEALRGRVYFAAEDIQAHGADKHIHAESADQAKVQALLEDYAGRTRAMNCDALSTVPKTDQGKLTPWAVLVGLGLKRIARLERTGFRPVSEPVELRPWSALFTAWRAARTAG
jgi:phytoene synthase